MYFFCRAHQHKAKAYIMALKHAGYKLTYSIKNSSFILMDFEWAGVFAGYKKELRMPFSFAESAKKPVFLYPHSVRPNIPFDLIDKQYEGTKALFTIAKGHKEVLERIGYPNPIEVTGWSYTDIKPHTQRVEKNKKIRVLFAPIHPVGTGFLPDIDRELNAKTYKLLLGMLDNITLTVRHLQPLVHNGLWENRLVRFVASGPTGDTSDMNRADIVISAFTYAHMAVALGHPLIMLGEGVIPHNSPRNNGELIYAKNWEKYRDYMRYPFNVEDCQTSNDLLNFINEAMEGGQNVEDWKEKFIGEPFNEKKFVERLESYL